MDIALTSITMLFVVVVVLCTEGDVRLRGGMNPNEGRVEICKLEQWQTICNDGWAEVDASVVCRQLRFSRQSEFLMEYWCVLTVKV